MYDMGSLGKRFVGRLVGTEAVLSSDSSTSVMGSSALIWSVSAKCWNTEIPVPFNELLAVVELV